MAESVHLWRMTERASNQNLSPFSMSYTPQIPELLYRLGCTLVISTFQAGKVIFISAEDENRLVQLPRTFAKPMGIAEGKEHDLALATKDSVIRFRNSPDLAKHYPKSPGKYDALFLPRSTYHTGPLDVHDIRIGSGGAIFAVNTLFSCISIINEEYNFIPWWTPPFIDKLASEDRCHLNGMAMSEGQPVYASMFGEGNSTRSWASTLTESGVIYHIPSSEPVVHGLAMPHSPRLFDGELYVLLSATGELARVDIESGKYDVVTRLNGFIRGMSRCGEHLFVGLSKIRENSSSFGKLDIAGKTNKSGIAIIHLPTGALVGKVTYNTSVDEIYDIHILENTRRPNILNTLSGDHNLALMTPTTTYWARPNDKPT